MKYLIKPKKTVKIYGACEARCTGNCFGKCNSLGNCFCPLKN